MEKEQFIGLLSAGEFTLEQIDAIDRLVIEHPYFSIGRFLQLKSKMQAGILSEQDIQATAVYSSDRRRLFEWLNGEDSRQAVGGMKPLTEIEFLDSDEEMEGNGLMGKDDIEMEDPDVEASALPVIDHIEDEPDHHSEEDGTAEPERAGTDPGLLGAGPDIVTELEKKPVSDTNVPGHANKSRELIERFIHSDAGPIPADRQTSLEGDVAEGSVKEHDSFITDTLAQIYIKQGLYAKAIYAYERLSLKYPEKSAYFAAQIEKIKNLSNT